MKKYILTILFTSCIQLCFAQNLDKLKDSLKVSTKWKIVEYKKGVTDTVGFKNRLPDPLLKIIFAYDTMQTAQCLRPGIEFYPITLRGYLDQTLMNYMLLRSSIYPPQPNTYVTKDYYIIAWNMTDYGKYTCGKMDILERKMMNVLKMKKIWGGKMSDFYSK